MSDDVLAELEQLLGPQPRRKRYRLKGIKFHEVSLVRHPANIHCHNLLHKSLTPSDSVPIEKIIRELPESPTTERGAIEMRVQESIESVMIEKARTGFSSKQEFSDELESLIRQRGSIPVSKSVANEVSDFLKTEEGQALYNHVYINLPDEDYQEEPAPIRKMTSSEKSLFDEARAMVNAGRFDNEPTAVTWLIEHRPGLLAKIRQEQARGEAC